MSTQEILRELPLLTFAEQEIIAQTLHDLRTSASSLGIVRQAGLHAGAWEVSEDFDDELTHSFWMGGNV
jgi:hypothetical protein